MGMFRTSRLMAVWTVLALAFAVRALVPAGWMPGDLSQGSVLMPCPTDGAMARIFGDAPARADALSHDAPTAHAAMDHAMHEASHPAGHMAAPVADHGAHGDAEHVHDAPPCAFTAVALDVPGPPVAELLVPPVPEAQRAIAARAHFILARSARERPPGRAPPLTV